MFRYYGEQCYIEFPKKKKKKIVILNFTCLIFKFTSYKINEDFKIIQSFTIKIHRPINLF